MSEVGGELLARDIEELLSGEQGLLLASIGDFIRSKVKKWAFIFFAAMLIGYPLAGSALSWLLTQTHLVPDGVSIVVLQPLEVVILQLRLAAHFAIAIVGLTVVGDAARLAAKNEEIRAQISGVKISQFSALSSIILALLCAIGLAAVGIFYVIDFLLPLLLDYLQADAAAIGATTTWQLAAWIGFIAGLCLGAAIGFQVPLVTLIALRGGIVERKVLSQYRRHLWFAGFCIGAMLSPPDPLSMFLVSGPMLILFEAALVIDRIIS